MGLTRQLAATQESADELTSDYVEDAIYESRKEPRPSTIRRQQQDVRNFKRFLTERNYNHLTTVALPDAGAVLWNDIDLLRRVFPEGG